MPRRTPSSSSAALRSASAGPEPQARPEPQERPEPPERPEYRVEALAKGLRILSLFDEQRPSWRVSDLAAAAGLPMPTVYRVVMTLASEGYLDHLPNADLVTANIQVGSTLPAVHTSIGKLLLAYLGDADLAARITDASFSANSGPNAKVSLAELREELRTVRD